MGKYTKFYVALIGALTQVLNLNLVHGDLQHDLTIALAVITAIGVVLFPNTPTTA